MLPAVSTPILATTSISTNPSLGKAATFNDNRIVIYLDCSQFEVSEADHFANIYLKGHSWWQIIGEALGINFINSLKVLDIFEQNCCFNHIRKFSIGFLQNVVDVF